MADNDDKRIDDTGAKKTLTLKGGPGLGNRPGMSRGPSRSTVVVEKRTQGRDHPILITIPETYYLKCFILRKL